MIRPRTLFCWFAPIAVSVGLGTLVAELNFSPNGPFAWNNRNVHEDNVAKAEYAVKQVLGKSEPVDGSFFNDGDVWVGETGKVYIDGAEVVLSVRIEKGLVRKITRTDTKTRVTYPDLAPESRSPIRISP